MTNTKRQTTYSMIQILPRIQTAHRRQLVLQKTECPLIVDSDWIIVCIVV